MPPRYLQLKRTAFNLACACHLMHAGLVGIYVALVIVAYRHYEHNINYPFTSIRQTTMSATVTIATQTFSIVRYSIDVLSMQS